jgi:hypothetical protein
MIDYADASSFMFPKDADFLEPSPKEKRKIRARVYRRDDGCCVVCHLHLVEEPGSWWSAHLHHKSGGIHRKDWSDGNLEIRCIYHHSEVHNPKAVPPKAGNGHS